MSVGDNIDPAELDAVRFGSAGKVGITVCNPVPVRCTAVLPVDSGRVD